MTIKRIILMSVALSMLFTLSCFANESAAVEVVYECEKPYSVDEVIDLIEAGEATSGDFKVTNDFILNEDTDVNVKSVGDNIQLLEKRILPNGVIEEDYIATSIYDISVKETNSSNPGISTYATGQDSTSSIRMALSSIFTKTQNSAGTLVKITDFQVNYTKLDPQALVTKISVAEDSFGHIYNSTGTKLLYVYKKWEKSLGSKSSGINPNVVYNISSFAGESALSNYYVVVTDGETFAGTKATFTIKRNNGTSTWNGSVTSHIYLFGESL